MTRDFDTWNFNKARGYEEIIIINNIEYLIQYALKKKGEKYITYFFSIEYEKMSCFEDYAQEEIQSFFTLQDAKEFLLSKNADLTKFSVFKGSSPI